MAENGIYMRSQPFSLCLWITYPLIIISLIVGQIKRGNTINNWLYYPLMYFFKYNEFIIISKFPFPRFVCTHNNRHTDFQ